MQRTFRDIIEAMGGRVTGTVTDRNWVCGTPYVLQAVEDLVALRRAVEAGQ